MLRSPPSYPKDLALSPNAAVTLLVTATVLTYPAKINPLITGSRVSGFLLRSIKVTAMRTVTILMMTLTLPLLASNVVVKRKEPLLHKHRSDVMISALLSVF